MGYSQVRFTNKDLGFIVDDFLNQFDLLTLEERVVAYGELVELLPRVLREKRDAARKTLAAREREQAEQARQPPEAVPIHEALPSLKDHEHRYKRT